MRNISAGIVGRGYEMKRRLFAVCFAVLLLLCAASCAQARELTMHRNALVWEEEDGAEGYLVYDGETLLAETQNTAVLLRTESGERDISVYTSVEGEKGKLVGKATYVSAAYTQKTFSGSAALADYLRDDGYYLYGAQHIVIDYDGFANSQDNFAGVIYIANDVMKLSFLSKKRVTVRADLVIQQRATDFELELENIILQGAGKMPNAVAFDESVSAPQTNLILSAYGVYNAILCGYNAPNGAQGSGDGMLQHAGNGGTGGAGGCAVSAAGLLLYTEGDMRFSGGNGGDGGDGGNASGLNNHGSGGNGGRGGDAIRCKTLEYFCVNGTLAAEGGIGGDGGAEGQGGFGVNRAPGKKGSDGAGIAADETNVLRGEI